MRGEGNATIYLEPGNYAWVCFVPGPDGVSHLLKHNQAHAFVVRPRTGNTSAPSAPNSSIQALLDAGFIAEVASRSNEGLNDERRRYYRMTAAGRKAARDEAERLADVLRVARAKKILRGEYV